MFILCDSFSVHLTCIQCSLCLLRRYLDTLIYRLLFHPIKKIPKRGPLFISLIYSNSKHQFCDSVSWCTLVSVAVQEATLHIASMCNRACFQVKLIMVESLTYEVPPPLYGLQDLIYLCSQKKKKKNLRNEVVFRWTRGGSGVRPQFGEMVRLRKQLHVRHLRMLMVMCMRGPKLKSRL